jgi:hypothetical protein
MVFVTEIETRDRGAANDFRYAAVQGSNLGVQSGSEKAECLP